MNGSEPTAVTELDPALLDRLVDGELNEAERASLLRAIDLQPDAWKRCALAFLEAQSWREAASAAGMGVGSRKAAEPMRANRRRLLRRMVAVAAIVAVAFSIGFASRDALLSESALTKGRIARQTMPSDPATATASTPIAHSATTPSPTVPESLRLQMERQGYRVEGDRRVVPVALGDGRKVALPVDTVSLRYVGQRVY